MFLDQTEQGVRRVWSHGSPPLTQVKLDTPLERSQCEFCYEFSLGLFRLNQDSSELGQIMSFIGRSLTHQVSLFLKIQLGIIPYEVTRFSTKPLDSQ